ncbi:MULTISPECIES: GTPase Era [Marinobacter]|jgi:GTP-binding protein Era|uniref:GTPase Era n=1 Tax=Marinobacter vinifirmus TaxID=355591 RepID=A0A7Z1DV94_9GAMM|nr:MULTISPECIES: GTPase Era [Marinobacter]HBM49055.1 GTPase Era [Marinobacter sp.]ERP93086.1 GTPase Era [Marinobacter sp. ES-1]KRW83412.1 GTPase Era [Marinobacter sp. P4B1]MCE0757660.1 GTPase Era [Marinobacter sp. G11]OZC36603.1 GTPase Era [Marinobacter vinifirmus]
MNDITRPENPDSRCGFVAIVGRPNVGKSTLLNHILGQKLSITSRKPQTTRHQVLGIKTVGPVQAIYVDTPGMHEEEPRALNRYMNKAATSALIDVDVVVFVVDQLAWTSADEMVLEKLKRLKCPVILAVNKVDKIEKRDLLLPHLETLSKKREFAEIIPLSALKETNLKPLEEAVGRYLPESVHFYPDDQITDRSERFMASEMVREKITRQLGAELPYSVAVEIEEFKHQGKTLHISALILVEREGQRKIIIGDKGERLRQIGQDARMDMEKMFGCKVMLRLWVKVKRGWADSDRALKSLGMSDF